MDGVQGAGRFVDPRRGPLNLGVTTHLVVNFPIDFQSSSVNVGEQQCR
jgi:hypothetical protein